MGRVVAGLRPGTLIEYVPEALGNAESDDPMSVVLRVPTNAERRELELSPANPIELVRDSSGMPVRDPNGTFKVRTVEARAETWRRLLVEKFVAEVRGYTVFEVEVKTGEQLADHGETAIYVDVFTRIMALLYLEAEQGKSSAESSGSTPQTTRRSNGIAASVEGSVSTDQGIAVDPMRTPASSTSPADAASP